MMKIAICDDEIQFIHTICPLLEQWAEQHDIRLTLHPFTNGDDLIASQQKECMDLIFLDVIMPLLNGIDTAREIRKINPAVPIIFLTSSVEFAVDSYEVKAFHYLIKPANPVKLFRCLDDFLKMYNSSKITFTAQTASGFYKVILDDVDYLEAQNKKVLVHQANGKTIEICELFSTCENIFSLKNGFYRCHRSYIVNLSNIERFTKTEIITVHNTVIPISRNRYAAFKEAYFHYMYE